jgi:hypothetical protein
MSHANIAASIAIVPEPQKGSYNGNFRRHPDKSRIAAAVVSRNGAAPPSSR